MKKKLLTLFVLLIGIISVCSAMTLKGVVVDKTTGVPVENAIISDGDVTVTSDSEGRFEIQTDNAEISAKRMGYAEKVVKADSEYVKIKLQRKSIELSGIKVSTTRVTTETSPITFTNIEQEEILEESHGQDIPLLINDVPNLHTYSEAGSALGYSHMKVRGFDEKRIGVMVNGIPFNDPEDHSVYWVNMPDLAESVENIQFQKGVGNSQYGVSTFGGSLNLMTNSLNNPHLLEVTSNYGSYDTFKNSAKVALDITKNLKTNLRFSNMVSDGYRDNAGSEMWSYFFNLSYVAENNVTEFNTYGGKEITHASWYASPEAELEANPQYNPVTYENEVDNFSQPHYELHNRWRVNDDFLWQNSAFYIRGHGYYEQLKEGKDLYYYSLSDEDDDSEADFIRQKWVTKNHYGVISNLSWSHFMGELTFGTYLAMFDSDHWGEIENVSNAVDADGNPIDVTYTKDQKYHQYKGNKDYMTFYMNENFKLNESLSFMANLHYQGIKYSFEQEEVGNFTGENLHSYEVDYNFLNPRFGFNYQAMDELNIYGNVSMAQREPADQELYNIWDDASDLGTAPLFEDYTEILDSEGNIERIEWRNPVVQPEKVINYEIGQRSNVYGWEVETALFWMDFSDEIVRYGGVDSDGYPNMGNAEKTVHRGIELSLKKELINNLMFSGNISYNDNYFDEFVAYDTNWDTWETFEVDFSGNKIANFPDLLANAKASYTWRWVTTSCEYKYVGRQYIDNTENDDRSIDPYGLVNLGLLVKIPNKTKTNTFSITFNVNNVLDESYYTDGYYDAWSGGNQFWIGAERNFMIGFRAGI